MKKFILCALLALTPSLSSALNTSACHGQFPNLFTDICWDCTFPIKLFGATIMGSDNQDDYNSGGGPNLCTCTPPGSVIPKTGFYVSFWEFARQAEVTRTPYCMVSLGFEMDMGIGDDGMGSASVDPSSSHGNKQLFRHVHWYINPAMGLMQVLLDSECLEPKGFDIAYLSEIDPTHIDPEMERILNPESYLFGNVVTQLACAVDCIEATVGFGDNALFWCDGCNGGIYPMTGWIDKTYGGVQASSLMTHRITAKLHRMLTQWAASGKDAMCGYVPQINMDKRQYKYSMIYPSAQSSADNAAYPASGTSLDLSAMSGGGASPSFPAQSAQAQASQSQRCCQPYGRTTVIWGAGREIPETGEDFSYAIFRKRDCCQFN